MNPQNGLKGRLLSGIIWNMLGLGLSKGIVLITSIIIARLLKPEIYGQYGMINSTVAMFATFAGLGLGVTCTRYVAYYRKEHPERIGAIIALTNSVAIITGVIMAILLFIFAPVLAEDYLGDTRLIGQLRIVSLLLIFNTFTGVQTGSLAGFEEFKKTAIVSGLNGVISFPIIICGVVWGGLTGLLWANVIISILLAIMNTYALSLVFKKYNIKLEFKNALKEKSILWNTSIPSMLTGVMVGPITWYANTIILETANGFSEIGLFNAAYQWRTILSFIPATIASVFLPILISEKNNEKMEKINIIFSWSIVIVCALPILAFPEIISIFYGKDYNGDSFKIVLILTALIACILAYKEGISRKLISENLIWFGVMSNLVWGGLLIIFTILFKAKGAVGLSIAYALSYVINTVIFIPYYLQKKVVSKELILSKPIVLIWLLILGQLITGLLEVNIIIRAIVMLINVSIIIVLIWKIVGGKKNECS